MEYVGTWDFERDESYRFKDEKQLNDHVRRMSEDHVPSASELKNVFSVIMETKDDMAFTYWENQSLLEEDAHRYVCMPHVPGFWDHVLVGTKPHQPAGAEATVGPDPYLPRLFDVKMENRSFHWCCFVLKKQIILALWCTTQSAHVEEPRKIVPLIDSSLRDMVASTEFRRMIYYLREWFTVQYCRKATESDQRRELHVVLDSKLSEGPTLVHLLVGITTKNGMNAFTPSLSRLRNRAFGVDATMLESNNRAAIRLFCYNPCDEHDLDSVRINITEEYNDYHQTNDRVKGQLNHHICTKMDCYNYI